MIVVTTLLSACGSSHVASNASNSSKGSTTNGIATVKRVVDGDTIIVNVARKAERVRLIGVDSPETVDPHRPVGCYGKQASDFTKSLLPPGTEVRLVLDVEPRDKYGRLLAYVYRTKDNLFVDAELARLGYANVLTIPPNVAHADEFVSLVDQARAENRGLWASCPAPAAKSSYSATKGSG